MGVTVLPYIDQTQTARLQEAASANIQTPKNTDEAVTTFKECLASAERSVQAMAVDALLAASNSGAVSLLRIDPAEGIPYTAKKNGEHGIGLKNMRRVAKKYMGDLSFEQNGDEVTVGIMLQIV